MSNSDQKPKTRTFIVTQKNCYVGEVGEKVELTARQARGLKNKIRLLKEYEAELAGNSNLASALEEKEAELEEKEAELEAMAKKLDALTKKLAAATKKA